MTDSETELQTIRRCLPARVADQMPHRIITPAHLEQAWTVVHAYAAARLAEAAQAKQNAR